MTTPLTNLDPNHEESLANYLVQIHGGPKEIARRAVELAGAAKIAVERLPDVINSFVTANMAGRITLLFPVISVSS